MLAGGTDLLVALRVGRSDADVVVDGKNIPELNEITYDPDSGLTLGAAVPCYRIYGNTAVSNAYAGLIDAATLIGGHADPGPGLARRQPVQRRAERRLDSRDGRARGDLQHCRAERQPAAGRGGLLHRSGPQRAR